jgi:DNA repair exonuclease SbcCD ATPase subunit
MYISRVKAKNVYSFDEIDLNFSRFPVLQVSGQNLDEKRANEDSVNGIGKTNIYNLISQALYSRDILKTKKGYLKNMFSSGEFVIEVWVDDLVVKYSKSECTIHDGAEVMINGRKAVTEYFESILSYELFLPLTYISSTVYFPFFDATPKQQKDFITLVFADLLKMKDAVPILRENISELRVKLNGTEGKKEIYKKLIEEEIEDENIEVPELPELINYETKIKELDRKIREIEYAEARKTELESIGKPEETEDKSEEIKSIQERIWKGNGIIEIEEAELKKLVSLKDYSECPTCGAEIKYDASIEKEKKVYIDKLINARDNLNVELVELKKHQEKYDEYVKQLDAYTKSQNELANIHLVDKQPLVAEIEELKLLERDQQELYENTKEQREKAIRINAERQAKRQAQHSAQIDLAALEKEEAEDKSVLKDIELLLEICDKTIVEKQIPKRLNILEKYINSELATFTSQYKVKLDMDDKIRPKILKKGKEYPYENCSQGERGRINLALMLAIRIILEKLGKKVPNLIFVDELLNIIDTGGKQLIVEALERLDANCFIVCHDYDFDVPQIVLVKQDNKTIMECFDDG